MSSISIYIVLSLILAIFMLFIPFFVADWRRLIYGFFLWLIIEDLIRKYLGNNMAIYFVKDVLVAITYLLFLIAVINNKEQTFRPPLPLLLAILSFFGLGLLQTLNLNSPSIFYGLMGLKLYFYYIPLILLGYALPRSEDDLRHFLSFNLIVAGIVALLGIIQSIIGPSFLNPTVLAPEIETLGTLFRESPTLGVLIHRPSSVFVSSGRFGMYLIAMFLLGIGTINYLVGRKQTVQTILIILCFGSVATAIIMTGSRGALMFPLISMPVLIAALLWGSRRGQTQVLNRFARMFVAMGIGLAIILALFPTQLTARLDIYTTTMDPRNAQSEFYTRTWNYPVDNFLFAFTYPNWFSGYGIGTASLGTQYVTSLTGARQIGIGVESGYGTLLLELGAAGPLLWIIWTTILIATAWKVVRQLRGTALFPVGLVILWYAFLLLFPMTFGGLAAYQNFVMNAYLWLLLGVLFRLPTLLTEQLTREQVAEGYQQVTLARSYQ